MSSLSNFFLGSPGKIRQQSTLGKEQQGLYNQLLQAGQRQGAGGAFGQSADYYRGLLSNDSEDFNAFAAPELRRFREQTVPGLAEQFAGFGSGAMSGSGFRNAALNASTDLSERLASIRAGLRQQGAQGLMGIGQQGLGNYNENIYMQPTTGFLGSLGQGLGSAAGSYGAQNFSSLAASLKKILGLG